MLSICPDGAVAAMSLDRCDFRHSASLFRNNVFIYGFLLLPPTLLSISWGQAPLIAGEGENARKTEVMKERYKEEKKKRKNKQNKIASIRRVDSN